MKKNLYRNIPKIDDVLTEKEIVNLLDLHPRSLVVDNIRLVIDTVRKEISVLSDSEAESYTISQADILNRVTALVQKKSGL